MVEVEMKGLEEQLSGDAASKDVDSKGSRINDDPRAHWTYNFEFVAAAVAFSVDVGMMSGLPYAAYANGGGAFLMVYCITLFLLGVPMIYLELSLGQFFGKGPYHIWRMCPIFRGIGAGMIVKTALTIPYYGSTLSWVLLYFLKSFSSTLPWANCANHWNTPTCDSGKGGYEYNFTSGVFGTTPTEEYFMRKVLQIHSSSGIGNLGSPQWELFGCMLAVTIVMFVVLFWGVKIIGKVSCVAVFVICVCVLILLLRALTLPGSGSGVKLYLFPDFMKMLEVNVWRKAFLMALSSNGVCTGVIHTLASYKHFKSTALRDSILICGISAVVCFLAGLMLFGFYGFVAYTNGISTDKVLYSGPLFEGFYPIFSSVPAVFAQLQGVRFWSVLFFLLLLLAGVSTQLLALEVIITTVCDVIQRSSRFARLPITACVCVASFIFTLPFLTKGGYYLNNLLDWHMVLFGFPVLTILQCVTVVWIYGVHQLSHDIQAMTGLRPPVVFKFIWGIFIPLIVLVSMIISLVGYRPPRFMFYIYPTWAVILGWIISLGPLIPLPVYLFLAIGRKIKSPFSLPLTIAPASSSHKPVYDSQNRTQRSTKERLVDIFSI